MPDGRLVVREQGWGPPVVLVHGGTATGDHEWGAVADHLAASRRVVVVDVRAHGGSVNHGGHLGVQRFAADLGHVLRRLGIPRADFLGFSMGGNTVLHLLSTRVDLARRAVVVGASATGDPDEVLALTGSDAWPTPLRTLRHDVDRSPDYWRRLRDELVTSWAASTEIPPDRLARIRCPVLVVNGARDPIQSNAIARHLADGLPDARLELVADAGHAVHVDQQPRFLALVEDFLARNGEPHVA